MIKEVITPEISILMSIYNESESQIHESISSILDQTFADLELIIVCDNPNRDDVYEIMSLYQDKRIRLVYNENNMGLAMSMNKAAELARADLFARMDADDIAFPNRLQEEYKIFQESNVDVVFTDYIFIDDQSIDIKQVRSFPENLEGIVPSKMIATTPSLIHHPTVMMRREIFERVGGYRDFPCAQDSDLWMRMQESGAVFYLLKKPLLKYRINSEGTTQKKYFKQQLTMHYIYNLSIERLEKGKDNFSKDNYADYLSRCGIGSKSAEKRFQIALDLLLKAMEAGAFKRVIFRILVFVISSHHRNFYLMKRKKEKLLNESICS